MKEEECKSCEFFLGSYTVNGTIQDGICRRFPPISKDDIEFSEYPNVKSFWWCGEYKEKIEDDAR